MVAIGKDKLSKDVLEWVLKNNKKIAVDILSVEKSKLLGFKYPKVKRTIGANEITHTLKRHGENSPLVQKADKNLLHLQI